MCLLPQSCLTLCNPVDCSLPGSSVHGDSPGKNTAVGCHALLQGISPTQGLSPGLPHCRQILYHLSHQGNLWLLEWVAYPFSRRPSWPGNGTRISYTARWILYQVSYQGGPAEGYQASNSDLATICCVCMFFFFSHWYSRLLKTGVQVILEMCAKGECKGIETTFPKQNDVFCDAKSMWLLLREGRSLWISLFSVKFTK